MADFAFKKYWCFNSDIFNGRHRCDSDPFKMLLSNTQPQLSHTSKSDVIEIAAGAGYPAGGIPLVVTSSAQSNGLYKWIIQNVLLTATGTMAPWRYSVIYNSTSSGLPLVGYIDYGQVYSLINTDEFAFNFDQVNGLLNAPTVND